MTDSHIVTVVHIHCHDRTSSTVWCRDLNTLTTSLNGNSSRIHIFRLVLWLHQAVNEVCLSQPDMVYTKSKLVRSYMSFVRACSLIVKERMVNGGKKELLFNLFTIRS